MTKKHTTSRSKENTAKETSVDYKNKRIQVFTSFEEQDEFNLKQMAKLRSEEILVQLRQLINLAYGMHGYNPDKLQKNILSESFQQNKYF